MDGVYWTVLAVCLLLILIYCWYRFAYSPYQVFKKLGIPNPPVTPFIGNSEVIELGYLEAYNQWIKQYGKVFGYYLGAKAFMVIADPDMLKEITVKQFDNFVERNQPSELVREIRMRNNIPPGLVLMEGKEWKRVRPIVSPTFSAKKLKLMAPLVEKSCHALDETLDKVCTEGHSVDMWRIFGQFTLETILATAFGCQVNILKGEGNALTKAAGGVFSGVDQKFILRSQIMSSFLPASVLKHLSRLATRMEISQHFAYLKNVSLQLIEQRQQATSDTEKTVDLLQLLMNARVEETEESPLTSKQLTNDEIIALCIGFLLAGYETTSNLLAYTSYLLALNPDVQEKLSQSIKDYYQENEDASLYDAAHEIQYLDWVLHESLRIYPPAPRTNRNCQNTCTVNGVTIPKGCTVDVPIQYLHRSSEYWDHPEVFRPERFSPEEKEGRHPLVFIPFGWGPRNCVGLRFALMEAKMSLLSILKKYKFERAPDTQVPLKTKLGITQSPRDGIFLLVARAN